MHKLTFTKGSDARNHTVRCKCGWAHANTAKACQIHGKWHIEDSAAFKQRWDDPARGYVSRHFIMLEMKERKCGTTNMKSNSLEP